MRKITISMVIICIVLGVCAFWIRGFEDRIGPTIMFPEDVIIYAKGDEAILLVGVKAIDDKDGNVSNTLKISGIYPNSKQTEASVVYLAKDKSNNVTTATRIVEYMADVKVTPAVTEELQVTPTVTEELQATPTPTVTSEPEVTESAEAPVITLAHNAVTVSEGEAINRLSYVSNITDDKDARNDLYKGIQIRGEVDTDEKGEYELVYYVVDADGNKSNEAKLIVIVE